MHDLNLLKTMIMNPYNMKRLPTSHQLSAFKYFLLSMIHAFHARMSLSNFINFLML